MNALAIPLSVINFLRTGELGDYKVKGLPTFDQLIKQNPASNRPVTSQQAESMFATPGISGAAGAAPATIPALPPKAVKAPKQVFEEGNAGGFENAGIGGIGPFNDIIFNVNGGDPQAIVDALRAWERSNGPLPVSVQ
jgi:hypothetical protein